MKIQPNTKFTQQHLQLNTNWDDYNDTQVLNSVLFMMTCAKCVHLGGCHYDKIPCEFKKKFRNALKCLSREQQLQYLNKAAEWTIAQVMEDFSNIINIMER